MGWARGAAALVWYPIVGVVLGLGQRSQRVVDRQVALPVGRRPLPRPGKEQPRRRHLGTCPAVSVLNIS
jgi:hypothetical protein